MARDLVDPPTLFEVFLELRWRESILVEDLIAKLRGRPPFSSYHLERLAAPALLDDGEGYEEMDPSRHSTHLLRSVAPESGGGQAPRRLVYMSDRTVSYKVETPPFPKWHTELKPELDFLISVLCESFPGLEIEDAFLRFVNAFSSSLHGVSGVADLAVRIEIGGNVIDDKLVISFLKEEAECEGMIRIASGSVVSGIPIRDCTAIVDVLLTNQRRNGVWSGDEIKDWLRSAHLVAKRLYFSLFTEKMKAALLVESNG